MAAFTGVMAKSMPPTAPTRRPGRRLAQVRHIVKLIGGKPEDVAEALGLLVFPTAAEQASGAWLGGGKEAGATRAFNASAQFLKEQKQIDKALGTTAPT